MIYSIGLFYKQNDDFAFRVSEVQNLSSFPFFSRSLVRDFLFVSMREAVKVHPIDQIFTTIRHSEPKHNYLMNIMANKTHEYFYVMVTDGDYSSKASRKLLCILMSEFEKQLPSLRFDKTKDNSIDINGVLTMTEVMQKYNDPKEADKIEKIQKQLDEISQIMKDNINLVLERGVKLDDLVLKSEHLKKQSNEFLMKTKQLNRCCRLF
uniref:V-SNARE coiled-coil homology domain-containing protein n=1 Tax=viral metagenome TaxID=1070528 RepID=A0A6C0EDL5_9ZZZZ